MAVIIKNYVSNHLKHAFMLKLCVIADKQQCAGAESHVFSQLSSEDVNTGHVFRQRGPCSFS